MGCLDGKVALVTGAGAGLGRAIVRRFVAEGARVGILELSAERAEEVRQELGDAVVATVGDVTAWDDNQRAVADTISAFGQLNVFVGNAGIYDNRISLESLPGEKLSGAFDELFSVNVKGYLLGVKACLPELQRVHGCVIFTASVSSMYPGHGGILYVSAKHAIAGITRQLAYELVPDVRVNAVAPGYVFTELRGLEYLEQGASKISKAGVGERLPLKVVPEADDYAGLYVLLASDESSKVMTGTVILADGGSSMFHGRK